MSDKKLRIGFVGTGGIAFAHLNYLVKMTDVEVVACTDVSPANLEKAKTQYNVKGLYSDWREMLKNEKLDAVDVCTPNGLHKQPTIDALNAGCHVIVEKPLAMNAKEGEAMVAAAKKNKKHLVIGFQFRYSAPVQMLKQAADAGQFGNILVMKCQALRRRGIPNWGVFGRKELQGGGPMIDIGVHVMEMAHYVMGSPKPVAATGNVWTYLGDKPSDVACMWPKWDHKTYTVEDLAIGHIRFENGAVMQVEASFAAHCEDKWGFNFLGDKGGGTLDGPIIYRDQDGYMVHLKPDFLPKVDAFEVKMRSFVDTALYNKPTESPGEAGLAIQKMIDGIYESAARGREVAIK
jgi:predicted dehydrogenase